MSSPAEKWAREHQDMLRKVLRALEENKKVRRGGPYDRRKDYEALIGFLKNNKEKPANWGGLVTFNPLVICGAVLAGITLCRPSTREGNGRKNWFDYMDHVRGNPDAEWRWFVETVFNQVLNRYHSLGTAIRRAKMKGWYYWSLETFRARETPQYAYDMPC